MKKLGAICLLFVSVTVFNSFTPVQENNYYKNDGYLLAVIDSKNFELRDNDKCHAELIYRSSSMQQGTNSQKKQIDANLIFFGNSVKDEKGVAFNEKLEFQYSFGEGALGDVNDLKIDLNYDRKGYYLLQDESKMKITRLDWSADHRSYVMNADFDCQLRKWGYPAESQPIVHLRGKMENITVAVPSWINMKSPTQQAEGK